MSPSPPPYNVLLFWFHDDWGKYGRAYERVAQSLAALPEIGQVVCVFPAAKTDEFGVKRSLVVRRISPKLSLLTETKFNRFGLDRRFSRVRRRLNEILRDRALTGHFRKLGFRHDNTLLWLFPPNPYIERILNLIPRRGVVTHVIDNFTRFDPGHELYGHARAQYPELGGWSDLIITTSKANQEEFAKFGKPCYLFLPAVDESFIGEPSALPYRTSGEEPRLGYVGFIMDRTDLDLIRFAARQRPEWRFVLAGPQYPKGYLDNSGLLELPNVDYLGSIPQDEVPAFLRSLDICLMPHRDNEYSRSMGPLKLYQYLASGRPIVSTNIAGLEQLLEHVWVAHNREDFVRKIQMALQADTVNCSAERVELARQNTWSVRVGEMFEVAKRELHLA